MPTWTSHRIVPTWTSHESISWIAYFNMFLHNNYKLFALAKYFSLRSFLANKLTKFSSFFYFFFSLSHTISCSIWEIFAFPWGMYRRLENLLLVFLSAKTSKKWTSLEPQVRKRKYFLKWMRSKWNWGNIGHFRLTFLNYTLQMFAGIYRDSAGVFCNIYRENPVIFTGFPCNIYRLQKLQGKPVNITGFSLQILQKTPAESL